MPKLAVSWLMILGLALSVPALAQKTASCKLQRYGEIELEVTADGVTLPVQVNGKPGRMLLEIGSAFSAFWTDVANDLELQRAGLSAAHIIHIDGRPVYQLADFKSLSLGDVPFGAGTFLLVARPAAGLKDVLGLIGIGAFNKVDFELDLAHRKLTLFSQTHCPGAGQYRFDDNASMPLQRGRSDEWYVTIELEGRKVAAAFSSDKPVTTLSHEVAQRLYGFDENSSGVQVARDELRGTTYHYKAMQFTAPGLKVLNPTIALAPNIKGCGLVIRKHGLTRYVECSDAYPVYIGRDILLKMRLYFATKERMLYFAAAEPGSERSLPQ